MNYVADFETHTLTTDEEKKYLNKELTLKDLKTSVWGWGLLKVGETENVRLGSSIETFFNEIRKLGKANIYFHNLKFDGHFILSYLLNSGYVYDETRKKDKSFSVLISDLNVFYSIEVIERVQGKRKYGYKFLDSFKKLPYSVDRIAKAFDLDFNKVEVDNSFYTKKRDENHFLTDTEIEYIKNDVRVTSLALDILFKQSMDRMTAGSDALNNYKHSIGGSWDVWFPRLEKEVDDDIKLSYRGGVAMVKEEIRGQDIGIGKSYDINSMYPSIMYFEKLPYGYPLFFFGEYEQYQDYDLYIQELECEFKLKKNHLPTLQIKGQTGRYSPTEYLSESKGLTTLHLTSIDLKLFLEHYEVTNLTYRGGYMFQSQTNMFKDYIDHWNNIKETSTGAMRELAKLMLNSLYGKFGTKTDIQGKIPFLDENNIVKMNLGDPEIINPVYSAVATFITSYGRDRLIRTAQLNYDRFCYCDTDSIHLTGEEKPLGMEFHPTHLGKWDDDGTFTRARFLGAKCYIEDFIKEGLKVVCAGMTREQHKQVTYENFKEGLVVSGKLAPRVVKGGVVLVNVNYQVKVRGWGRY